MVTVPDGISHRCVYVYMLPYMYTYIYVYIHGNFCKYIRKRKKCWSRWWAKTSEKSGPQSYPIQHQIISFTKTSSPRILQLSEWQHLPAIVKKHRGHPRGLLPSHAHISPTNTSWCLVLGHISEQPPPPKPSAHDVHLVTWVLVLGTMFGVQDT